MAKNSSSFNYIDHCYNKFYGGFFIFLSMMFTWDSMQSLYLSLITIHLSLPYRLNTRNSRTTKLNFKFYRYFYYPIFTKIFYHLLYSKYRKACFLLRFVIFSSTAKHYFFFRETVKLMERNGEEFVKPWLYWPLLQQVLRGLFYFPMYVVHVRKYAIFVLITTHLALPYRSNTRNSRKTKLNFKSHWKPSFSM